MSRQRVGLNTTSVTYYFKRKEDLAAAAFDVTLDRLDAMLDEAHQEGTPEARVARYLSINMERLAKIHRGEEKAFAILSDLRAMEGELRTRLMQRWQQIFRKTRALWGEGGTRAETDLRGGRAHVLLENTFWLPAWITRYEVDEYPRVESRLMDVFRHGIATPGDVWKPAMLDLIHDEAEPGREAFLLAATRLINELGYRGASVQKIASELNVTKGSFYHHLDAKDELVIECYKRSFDLIVLRTRSAAAHHRAVGPTRTRAHRADRPLQPHRAPLCRDAVRRHRRRIDPRDRPAGRQPDDDGAAERRIRHAQMGQHHAPRPRGGLLRLDHRVRAVRRPRAGVFLSR